MSAAKAPDRPDLESLTLVSVVCGRIAHDLNNVLAAIDGYSEFVAQEVEDRPQVLADIGEVRSAAKKGAAFSRRLRQVGQLVEGFPEDLDLSEIVREAEEQIRLATGDAVAVSLELGSGLPPVHADRQQLCLALLSLVDNSCEAMSGGGTIELKTYAAAHEVVLEVHDTGAGMSPEILERVYQPFFSSKDKAIGNGLGLFIVEGVVRRAGGRVEIASTQGAGTSASLRLPAARRKS